MSFKHKRKAQKESYKERRAERAAEKERNTARKFKRPTFTEYKPTTGRHVETDGMKRTRLTPSHDVSADPHRPVSGDVSLADMDFSQLEARVLASVGTPEGELYSRELKARKIGDMYGQQLAPLYPKGPYQLITDPNAPKYFNKKDGGL